MILTPLLSASLISLLSLTAAEPVPPPIDDVPPQYKTCRYPGWPTAVLNFEHLPNEAWQTYFGLNWTGWSGYRTHSNSPSGWIPIPSNATTLYSESGPGMTELTLKGGGAPKEFTDVFSLWYNYRTIPPGEGRTKILFKGYYQGMFVKTIEAITDTADDGIWRHVCFDWTSGQMIWKRIDELRIELPPCGRERCRRKVFEVDDIWVRRIWL
ncbi:hypothetical protein FPQ18DRAFT_414579 [Pyronema domesticum]|uniref:Uncharacterized protein n=1 Tax=Pyronema omphalodes (strain CBS 100304) TaxID=1076935 RepID=U4L145_PYROM|nr:hypothetical protein FPQ18DRAFT_414579 [Pyronema domesticum]CCX08612.1 Protein of unknown function [Pyronema omphalodes CBS 100304]